MTLNIESDKISKRLIDTINPSYLNRLQVLSSYKKFPELPLDKAIVLVTTLEAGGSLLQSRRLVRELLRSLAPQKLKEIATKYCKKVYEKPFDNALRISKLPEPVLANVLTLVLDSDLKQSLQGLGVGYSGLETEKVFSSLSSNTLLPHQEKVVNNSISFIEDNKDFLIQMPTGAGKTTAMIMTLIRSGLLTKVFAGGSYAFWLAPTKELLEQAREAFLSLWARYGNGEGFIHLVGSQTGSTIIPAGVLSFMTYQAAAAWDNMAIASVYGKNCVVLVADEAHRTLAPTYQNAINALSNNGIKIGLTATPGRKADIAKDNVKLAQFFGTRIVRSSQSQDEIADLQSQGILSRVHHIVIKIPNPLVEIASSFSDTEDKMDIGEEISANTLNKLAENDSRNKIILEIIEKAIKDDHRVIFFGCTVEHSRLLCAALLVRGIEAASIDSQTSSFIRQKVVKRYKEGKIKVLEIGRAHV